MSHSPDSQQFRIADQNDIIDAETAAKFLGLARSELECRANTNCCPKFLTRNPLTYLADTLIEYGCEMHKSNTMARNSRSLSLSAKLRQGSFPNETKLHHLKTASAYRSFIRSYESNIPHPATHAITISFNRSGTDYAAMGPREFNEAIGDKLYSATQLSMARTLRRFAKIHSLYGFTSRSNYPFWLQGERYSKHGLSIKYLHLHGKLFINPIKMDDFTRRKEYFEECLRNSFQYCLCDVGIKLDDNYNETGYTNYSVKHINRDDKAFEWFVTNLRK